MGKILFEHNYDEIISIENLLLAWQEFVRGKRSRLDVQDFERQLMQNLISLHNRLADMSYRHAAYEAFVILDPKRRNIHKATVTDRVLHRAVYRKLYPFFDRVFISDSFSCRIRKGTHRAVKRLASMARKASQNHRKTVWVLKCDIKKFFSSIDQIVLVRIIDEYIADKRIVWLLETIVRSFSSITEGVGLPLGNLTSQLLANVYLNKLDQFVKHRLRAKHYIRYADDFVIFSRDRKYLLQLLCVLNDFLRQNLHLRLHADKIELCTVASGVDFLGWVNFVDHRVLRGATRRRMIRKIKECALPERLQSYLGLLSHGNTWKLRKNLET